MEKFNRKDVTNLQEKLSRLVKKPVHLTITDNTHSMIHIRPSNSGYKVRLHHMFLEADTGVLIPWLASSRAERGKHLRF